MTKSSAVLFILLFSLIFKLEEPVRHPTPPHRSLGVPGAEEQPCLASAVTCWVTLLLRPCQRAALVLVVLLIAGGLFLFTYKSTQFEAEGFAMVLGASFLGGVRWTRTQILLQKEELGLQNPIDTMFHLQPAMFLSLFPLFAVFEGQQPGGGRGRAMTSGRHPKLLE
ncbi:hypothetical protein E2320_009372 [Naja naja]|nr:hypothetical protein E2320_009372 [Naja naja]